MTVSTSSPAKPWLPLAYQLRIRHLCSLSPRVVACRRAAILDRLWENSLVSSTTPRPQITASKHGNPRARPPRFVFLRVPDPCRWIANCEHIRCDLARAGQKPDTVVRGRKSDEPLSPTYTSVVPCTADPPPKRAPCARVRLGVYCALQVSGEFIRLSAAKCSSALAIQGTAKLSAHFRELLAARLSQKHIPQTTLNVRGCFFRRQVKRDIFALSGTTIRLPDSAGNRKGPTMNLSVNQRARCGGTSTESVALYRFAFD
jgi:hypothetical protein